MLLVLYLDTKYCSHIGYYINTAHPAREQDYSMKALRFHEFGPPADVLQLEEIPTPTPTDDEVLVRLTARSVNPSDLYTIMGTYGVRPKLPAVGGNEAAGVVEHVGANVSQFAPGDRVTLMLGAVGTDGTWREYAAVRPDTIIHTPTGLSDEQAACAWVNYLTAWILAFEDLDLQPDELLLVTAAASHLGRAMLQIAAHAGFKVIGTVRREDQRQELLDLGAAGVIVTDSEDIGTRYRELTGKKAISKAVDAVGGVVGSAVAAALAPRGTLILYGMMSGKPLRIGGEMIFSEATVRGFWLLRWMQNRAPQHIAQVVGQLSALFADGTFAPAIDSTFDLADIKGMVERSSTPGRHGKVIITGPT